MRARERLSPLPSPSPPLQIDFFLPPLNNHRMATLEITIGPSVADNLRTYQNQGTDRRPIDPATTLRCGSITHDRKHGKMPSEWKDEDDFRAWLEAEESDKGIELIISHVAHSELPIWQEWRILKCSCEWTGGWQAQHNPGSSAAVEQDRKFPSKKMGCRCRLTLKFYQHTG